MKMRQYQRLGSVVTNRGYSDWATTDIDASVKSMCTGLAVGNQTIVLSAVQMASHSSRYVYAICGKGTGKFFWYLCLQSSRRFFPGRIYEYADYRVYVGSP